MTGLLVDISQETQSTSVDSGLSSEVEDFPYLNMDQMIPIEDVPEDGGSGMSIMDGILLCLAILILGFGVM